METYFQDDSDHQDARYISKNQIFTILGVLGYFKPIDATQYSSRRNKTYSE